LPSCATFQSRYADCLAPWPNRNREPDRSRRFGDRFPSPISAPSTIEVSNALIKRRFLISTVAALQAACGWLNGDKSFIVDALRTIGLLTDQKVNTFPLIGRLKHWERRGWASALHYYLWSRRSAFRDRDPDPRTRRDTLNQYLVNDGPPPSESVTSGCLLSRPATLPHSETLGRVLFRRRTVRSFSGDAVSEQTFSGLLWRGFQRLRRYRHGTRDPFTTDYLKSFGTAYDLYIVVYRVTGINPGLYKYDVRAHAIAPVRLGDFRAECTGLLAGQGAPGGNACRTLFSSPVQNRWLTRSYREPARRLPRAMRAKRPKSIAKRTALLPERRDQYVL